MIFWLALPLSRQPLWILINSRVDTDRLGLFGQDQCVLPTRGRVPVLGVVRGGVSLLYVYLCLSLASCGPLSL